MKKRSNPKIKKKRGKTRKARKVKLIKISKTRLKELLRLEKKEKARKVKIRKLEKYRKLMTEHLFEYRVGGHSENEYMKYKEIRNLMYDEFPDDARDNAFEAIYEAGWDEDVAENMSEWSE